MAFLSPSVARKRIRIDQQISNRKRERIDPNLKKSAPHSSKVSHRIHVAPLKGEFIHNRVEYYITRCPEYNPLLTTLTSDELRIYLVFLKSRYVQTFYGPLLQMLIQHKDNHGVFNSPVDPISQNIPTYYDVITNPIDLGTIRDKLSCGKYPNSRELIQDIRLVFQNAKRFNPPAHFISVCATSLLKTLDAELEKIRTRVEQNRTSQHNHCCSSCHGYPCRLCGEKCLKYSPPVYVCDGDCHERILRNSTYYIIRGKKGRFCQKCYSKKIVGMDKQDRKNLFVRKKNDEVFPESWIQCSRCREWMHCVCGLVHPRQASSSYVCPICLSDDPHRVPSPSQGAGCIPSCPLSEFLTQQIYMCVDEEVARLPEHVRPSATEMSQIKSSLIVRVLSNIGSSVTLKKTLAPLYSENTSQELTLPYQSKCIAFFQHRDGVDVILFVLYVHEFGDVVSEPNRRCIYISYLDSVHFLSPRFLRTPLYHRLMNAYLQYAKENGYCRAHIWACPPSRGDDYIFSHHPRDQRTPNSDHLIGWYRELLVKGIASGTVSHVSCQLDMLLHINAVRSNCADTNERQIRCFSARGPAEEEIPEKVLEKVQSVSSLLPVSQESSDYETDVDNEVDNDSSASSELSSASVSVTTTPIADMSPRPAAPAVPTALSELERVLLTTIPYFDGDYLPYVGDDLLKEIFADSVKPKSTKNTLPHSSLSTSSKSKVEIRERLLQDNIQQLPSDFLRKYAKSMLENPSRFMIAYLRPYCSRCGRIVVGDTWRCDDCFDQRTPFFLCDDCYHQNVYHAHTLSHIIQPLVPPLQERDPFISYPFLDKRHEFLRLCQGNFLQFDTLRHSILSTSVVMEFIFHKVPDPFLDLCDSCERILLDEYYCCKHSDDYRLCKECLNKDGGIHMKSHS